MGRVVCELLSTQNVAQNGMRIKFYTIMALTYSLLMNVLLDKHWYGFGGMQYTSVCNPLALCKMV